jgi:hypothetical protein
MTTYHVQINGSSDTRRAHLETRLRRVPGVITTALDDTGHLIVSGGKGLMPIITRTVSETGFELASPHMKDKRTPSMNGWYERGWLSTTSR